MNENAWRLRESGRRYCEVRGTDESAALDAVLYNVRKDLGHLALPDGTTAAEALREVLAAATTSGWRYSHPGEPIEGYVRALRDLLGEKGGGE